MIEPLPFDRAASGVRRHETASPRRVPAPRGRPAPLTPAAWRLCIALSLLLGTPLHAQEVPDSISIPRLAAVGRLYNAIRFFHPYLGYQGIAWDAAVAEALPRIRVAESRDDYRAALDGMLTILDDPATRVLDSLDTAVAGPVGQEDPLATRWMGDSVLVIRFRPPANPDFEGLTARLRALDTLALVARAVIFDLRAPAGAEAGGVADFLLGESGLSRALLPLSVAAPSERTRIHEGYAADEAGASASSIYHAGWQLPIGAVVPGGDSVGARPVIFLVNPGSDLPALALAAREAGTGRVIGEGDASRGVGATTVRMPMGEGLTVQLRTGELISAEGTIVPTVDTVVPVATGAWDPALDLAIEWATSPALPRLNHLPLPVSISPGTEPPDDDPFPSLGQRLVGLYRVWGAIDYFHAYRELYTDDWGAQLSATIPWIIHARDSVDYALAIAGMVSHIRDSHGFVRAPGLRSYFGNAPLPFAARVIEGRPLVTRLAADSLGAGVRPGDEIVRIDGESMTERMRRAARFISASNEDAGRRDALNAALRGPDSSVATLQLRGADGGLRTLRIARRMAYWPLLQDQRTGPILQLLPGRIGYADLDRLSGEMVDSMFRMFADTRGIIFDMRGYPKGTAWLIAPRLTDRTHVAAAQFIEPIARSPRGARGTGSDESDEAIARRFTQYLPGPEAPTYRGWTVMLIDERTQSQAEHTGLFLEAANRTRFIGSRTAGTNGDVTNVSLPGHITVWFTGLAVRHADGRPLQQVGLTPDIPVRATIRGVRAGRDEVLERALAYLRGLPMRGSK